MDDQKLEELSLNSKFNSISFNSSVVSVEAPAPRTAKAVIKPRAVAVPQTNDVMTTKENINKLLLVVKKSIKSPKINDN